MDKIIKIFLNIKHVKIISISAIFLIVTVLSVIILNKSISYNNIQNTASSYLNLKIETINPNIKFNHKLDLTYKADKFEVYNTTKTKKYLAIDKLNISIKPLNLLFNKLNIKNLSVDNVLIAISRNSKGEIDIIKDINMENLHRHLKHPYEITKLNSKINNFEIIFHDNYKIQSDIKFKTENNIIQISKRNKLFKITQKGLIETVLNSKTQTSLIDIDVSSKYPFKNINSKDLKTSITVKDANLHILSDIARNIVSKDIISLEGDCDLSLSSKEENQNLNLTVKNHKIKLKNKLISPFKKNIDLGIIFNIDKDTLNIENLKLSSNDLNFSTKGAISKFNTKNPQIDLKLDIINTELNNLLYYIPDNLIYFNPKGIPKLKSSNFFAKLDGSLEIKNSPLDIQGGLKASDIHIPDYPKPYRQNDVSARFIGNKVKIFTRVYTPQNEYITINGTSNLDDSLYGQYDIASTKNIDLAFAQKYLVPIQQIIGFNIGPVPIMKINGTGNIDIKTKGTIKDAQIFGTFKAFNASAEIDGLNAHLTNGDCELVFDNRNLIFKKIKGKINEADFSLSGIGNTKGEVELSANVKNSRLKTILDIFNNSLFSKPYINLTKNISATSGLASAEINLKGTIKDYEDVNFLSYLDLDGLLELQNSKIFLNNGLKLQKVTGSLDFGKTQKADFDFNI